MSQKNNDIIYTAADIEKYHKGLLSAKEMHALEKAALEDPFLSDALEGYATASVNMNEDIAELKNRLANRTEENKLVSVIAQRKSSFEWWKIAAMILLVAGAGLIIYQFSFNNKSTDIAHNSPVKADKPETKDSDKITSPALLDTNINSKYIMPDQPQDSRTKTEITRINPDTATKEPIGEKDTKLKSITNDTEVSANAPTVSGTPANANAERTKEESLDDGIIRQKKINEARQEEPKARKQNDEVVLKASRPEQKRIISAPNQARENNDKTQQNRTFNQTNVFHGRVTDAHNNALPFSNITNMQDTIGTYSDARGYFTLTSTDSVLNVQVSSLGFEPNHVQLLNNVSNNKVLLQEDRSSLSEIMISNKKANSNRSRNANMVLEEPEPADGWSNYDIYLANNLKVPETFKGKQTGTGGEVELSFEVNKNGEPFNITVKRSLCETCDKEAIRLIKEGPKWKRKAKKGRASVTVPF